MYLKIGIISSDTEIPSMCCNQKAIQIINVIVVYDAVFLINEIGILCFELISKKKITISIDIRFKERQTDAEREN